MNSFMQLRRLSVIVVLAALTLGSLAPIAEAGHGEGNGKRKRDRGERAESTRRDRGERVESTRRDRDGARQGRDHWVDRAVRDRSYRSDGRGRERGSRTEGRTRSYRSDRGYRTDGRWRDSGRDVYVERQVVRREVRPVYRTRTVYRDAYRPSYRHRSPYATYTVWRRGDSGAAFAGFVGGLFLGATLANAAPHGFAYYDPYCHDSFVSLNAYYSHCGHHHHARTVHVIEIPGGYDYDDYHYCDDCDDYYWGGDHDCD